MTTDTLRWTNIHRFLVPVFLCWFLILLTSPAVGSEAVPVKIGVLAKRGSENAEQKWKPTAEYLSKAIPAYSFEIVALDFPQVRQAVKEKTIDFLITNSGYYVELEQEFGVSRIATMKNLLNHKPKSLFGGVVFTRADRADINNFSDLDGKRFFAVAPESLGGWLMALREFHAQGINPQRDFKKIEFAGTHDAVVQAVLSGKADAGTVRTDTLEMMAEEGSIHLSSIKILNAQAGKDNFHYLRSTRLYPEWPFAKLKHTPEKLSEDVTIALLSIPPQSAAVLGPHIGGWTVPLDYQPVHELMQELELGIYAHRFGKIQFWDFVKQYLGWLVLIFFLVVLLVVFTIHTARLNRKLVSAQAELAEQLKVVNQAQIALQQSESNYREIFHSTNDAFFVHDLDSGGIVDVNKAMCEMYGYSREEALCVSVGELSAGDPPFTPEYANQLIDKALTSGPQTFDWLAKRKNGDFFWVEITLKLAVIGGMERLLAVVHNIDERKKAEEELQRYQIQLEHFVEERTVDLRESEASLAEAQRIAHLGSWEWLIPENKLRCSAETIHLFGLKPGEIFSTYDSFLAGVHPDDRKMVRAAVTDALEKKGTYSVEHRIVLPDGTERHVYDQGEVFWDDCDTPVRMVGIVQDITERKILEMERTRLATAVEYVGESILITDQEGKILYVNPAFSKITGYKKEEAIGHNPRFLQSGRHNQEFYATMWKTLKRGESWSGHFVNRKKDGSLFEEDATISPILDSEGTIVNYVAVKHDVTEKVELQKQLSQAQKLESLGTLAGGIAHDFNNILAAILGYGELVLYSLPDESSLRVNQQQVLKAVHRATELVKQILTFSRRSEPTCKPIQVREVVAEALQLLRASIPAFIEFRLNLGEDCGTVLADPTQLHQITMNLCTNAYHAMRGRAKGVLGVSLTSVELGSQQLQNKIALRPGSYVKIEVSDNGQGMSKEVMERIFEPYYTTKIQGDGTGLGLSQVHGIVKSIGGDITVDSEVGTGSIFHVYLPKVVSENSREAVISPSLQGGNERLLVVDDEVSIVQMEKQILESLGYQVTLMTSSTEAWRFFERNPDSFDLVLTDMTMPNMSGFELATKIMQLRKDTPVILCTGYSEIINEKEAKAIGICQYLMKPITRKDLAIAIRQALG